MSNKTMEEFDEDYRGLCTILLCLSLTREIGEPVKHDIAIKQAEAGIKAVCEVIEESLPDYAESQDAMLENA